MPSQKPFVPGPTGAPLLDVPVFVNAWSTPWPVVMLANTGAKMASRIKDQDDHDVEATAILSLQQKAR